MDTREALTAAIAETLGLHPNGIAGDQTLADLGADSLDMVEIAMAVEGALELENHISDEAMEESTIDQICVLIDAMKENM